jgi:outer membrane protein OmpA-like peptidoglycan-associated protein
VGSNEYDLPETISLVPERSRKDRLTMALLAVGVLGCLAVLAGAIMMTGSGSDDTSTAAPPLGRSVNERDTSVDTTVDDQDQRAVAEATVPATDTTTAETSEPDATVDDTDTTEVDEPDDTDDTGEKPPWGDAEEPVRYAIYQEGVVYLHGRIPTQEIIDEIVAKTGVVVGAENVVNEYTIDPDAENPDSSPLYVLDYIQFHPGSAELWPDFMPLVDQGLILLKTFPNVKMTVVGHTDGVGTDEANLALSAERIEVIFDYWRERGVADSQLIADPRGESEPIASNDTGEGRALNRRVEVNIEGLLD